MDVKPHEILRDQLEGVNLSKLARDLGIPKQRLHDWYGAKRFPNFKNVGELKKLADHLGLTMDQLLFGESGHEIVSSTLFQEGGKQYKILIERLG